MIELGALVRSVDDGELGIIMWVDDIAQEPPFIYQIAWMDGLTGLHPTDEFEVIA